MVSPDRIIRTASPAVTIFPFLALSGGSEDNMGWVEARGSLPLSMVVLLAVGCLDRSIEHRSVEEVTADGIETALFRVTPYRGWTAKLVP
jgi:branched-subunit amino acid transport protein AzlD